MDSAEKIRENRVRRLAHRRGLELQRHRARDTGHVLYGTYQITRPDGTVIAARDDEAFGCQYGLSLAEAEVALSDSAELERWQKRVLAAYRGKMATVRRSTRAAGKP